MTDFTNALAATFRPTERLFIFSYDFLAPGLDGLFTYIKDSRNITSWSYINPGVYLLRSYDGAHTLTAAFRSITGGARLIVAEIDKTNISGHLPNPAWEWLFGLKPGTLTPPQLEAPKLF